jgi:hypothetical protein
MTPLEALGWGALGAIAVHALPLLREPTPARRPTLLAEGATWVDYAIAVTLRVGIGAGITFAYAHDVPNMTALLALNVGAAWPVLIRGFNRALPKTSPGRTL